MKTPSQYPVLDNRPIDQWKVTELREELKRRKLPLKGLKDDLIRRLDDALRLEGETGEHLENGIGDLEPDIANVAANSDVDGVEIGEAGTVVPAQEITGYDDGKGSQVDINATLEDIQCSAAEQPVQDERVEEKETELVDDQPLYAETLLVAEVACVGVGGKFCDSLVSETVTGEQADKLEKDNEDSRAQLGSEDVMAPIVDLKLDTSDPNNQVSEVTTNLGFPIKSNSISTESVSIIEKNELLNNIIDDNVKLESDVKPELVQPSLSNLVVDGGNSHPKDVEDPLENKVSVKETDNYVTNADMSQKNPSADLGSSEKLKLDRSSGHDSMEENASEGKQIESVYNSEEIGERTEKNEVTTTKEGPVVEMDTDLPAAENKDDVTASSDKRKLPVLNNEPSKRLRRWKSENNKVKEPHFSNLKDVLEPAAPKHFSRSFSVGDNAKERVVPPSTKVATNSLRIDCFLRPFTLKAVQELLAKTGTVSSFWMDHIKTHCYVTYSSVEEAVDTRNAVYNLQWPPNGGRLLVAEFVDPKDVKLRVNPPSHPPAAPVSIGPTTAPEPPSALPQPTPRQLSLKQRLSQQPALPPPPPLPNHISARECAQLPPPAQEKIEAPIVTLDDLFRKTKATPRIYYLPLTEELVSAKLEEQRKI